MPGDRPPALAILAGGGALPRRLVETCRSQGRPVFVVAFDGQTEAGPWLDSIPHGWFRLGAAGAILEALKRAEVRDVVMLGPIHRPSFAEMLPDATGLKILSSAGLRAGFSETAGDDRLLRAIAQEIENRGFSVVGAADVLSGLCTQAGYYGTPRADQQALSDIALAVKVARATGALDVGQGAVVQQGVVLAVEAIEGTDAMLARCRALARPGAGGVLAKVCKPGQDRRFDLPTMGVETVHNAAAAGLRGVAVEAGRSLLIDSTAVAAAADASGLFVFAFSDEDLP